ncbi:MAG TPA: EAL domain-containing protein [Methylibium sp.]|nr:EAL domain-containing protein [Methylibium sp.]
MRRPWLSIRAAVLTAIVVGVVLPALLFVLVDQRLARSAQEPAVERNRAAVVALATAAVIEPVWTLSEPALRAALERILSEPTVCEVAVLDYQPAAAPVEHRDLRCVAGTPVVRREAPVMHEGQTIARLRIGFDGRAVDQALAERRDTTLWLVAAQVLFGVAVLAGVLSLRLLRPIDRLKQQAGSLAASGPGATFEWPNDDELGQLGRHLSAVHAQNRRFVDELEAKNAALHRLAMHDQLTGLPNRRLLRELFEHEAAAARREHSTLALLFIDLDHFKTVNDTHGHSAGDELLVAVAQQLGGALRGSDVVCRMGGDEFLVLLPRVEGWEQVAATVDRLLQRLTEPLTVPGLKGQVRIGASVGIALYPRDGADFDALARTADLAMYRSKDLGRGRYSFFHADLDTDFRARLELERQLAEAIEQREFVLHLQPVIDLSSGRTAGCEALLRWQHPQRGLLAPGAFIDAAERTGLIHPLGRWVIDAACAQLAAWRSAGAPPVRIAVNLSAQQLRDPLLPEALRAAMTRHAVGRGEIELELTESTLLAEGEDTLATLAALRGAGALLALDDFGTGYSSLSYLKRLRPDKLKIDRSFVQGLPGDADDRALVQAIIAMARALGVSVVAEGVETADQRDWLLGEGCVLQQGYLFARPMAAEALDLGATVAIA